MFLVCQILLMNLNLNYFYQYYFYEYWLSFVLRLIKISKICTKFINKLTHCANNAEGSSTDVVLRQITTFRRTPHLKSIKL